MFLEVTFGGIFLTEKKKTSDCLPKNEKEVIKTGAKNHGTSSTYFREGPI